VEISFADANGARKLQSLNLSETRIDEEFFEYGERRMEQNIQVLK
jgi:hypothetical protein